MIEMTYEYLADTGEYRMSEVKEATKNDVKHVMSRLDAKNITFLKLFAGQFSLRVVATKRKRFSILAGTGDPTQSLFLVDEQYLNSPDTEEVVFDGLSEPLFLYQTVGESIADEVVDYFLEHSTFPNALNWQTPQSFYPDVDISDIPF